MKIVGDTDHHIYDSVADEVKGVDGDVARGIEICPTNQYHIRLYELDRSETMVIGQAHQDPCDHNQIASWFGNTEAIIDEHSNQTGEATREKISEIKSERTELATWSPTESDPENRGITTQNPWRFAFVANEVKSWWQRVDGFDTENCTVDNNDPIPSSSKEWRTRDGKIRYIYKN